jgi:hypothetical protein
MLHALIHVWEYCRRDASGEIGFAIGGVDALEDAVIDR